jgi:1,2-diacylglycerol 3-alpha-glucosyltransferase
LTDRIRFIGVVHDRDMLHRIYARANLFLFPSLYDTFAIVVREAASVGCPALLIRNSDAAQSINDGVNGYLADHNPTAYAQKLTEILSDLPAAKAVGLTAQSSLCRSWEQVVDDIYEEYQRIIAEYKRRHSLPMSQF